MSLPWNRIFHELNLTPLINKMNELAQTVEQLASQIVTVNNPRITIKQGGETKGSFTLNQAGAQTINLDAGGGGGSTYTAGDGIDITNNVISVTNPLKVLSSNITNVKQVYSYLPDITNPSGEVATLADFNDLGETNYSLEETVHLIADMLLSGTYHEYDYSSRTFTDTPFSNVAITKSDPNIAFYNVPLFDKTIESYVSIQLSSTIFANTTMIVGKKGTHVYFAFMDSNDPSNSSHIEFNSATTVDFKLVGV